MSEAESGEVDVGERPEDEAAVILEGAQQGDRHPFVAPDRAVDLEQLTELLGLLELAEPEPLDLAADAGRAHAGEDRLAVLNPTEARGRGVYRRTLSSARFAS